MGIIPTTVAKPKLCINSKCGNTFYVPNHHLPMCLQCSSCTEARTNSYEPQDALAGDNHYE